MNVKRFFLIVVLLVLSACSQNTKEVNIPNISTPITQPSIPTSTKEIVNISTPTSIPTSTKEIVNISTPTSIPTSVITTPVVIAEATPVVITKATPGLPSFYKYEEVELDDWVIENLDVINFKHQKNLIQFEGKQFKVVGEIPIMLVFVVRYGEVGNQDIGVNFIVWNPNDDKFLKLEEEEANMLPRGASMIDLPRFFVGAVSQAYNGQQIVNSICIEDEMGTNRFQVGEEVFDTSVNCPTKDFKITEIAPIAEPTATPKPNLDPPAKAGESYSTIKSGTVELTDKGLSLGSNSYIPLATCSGNDLVEVQTLLQKGKAETLTITVWEGFAWRISSAINSWQVCSDWSPPK